MNATHMMIDPNELVIDMPVDEGNVKLKMESLQSSGMVQPVTVWLQDLRIIDGFHRTEAAKRLGWSEIPCNVIDCTEDAFWDARIQSAKQHHTIEEDRLQAWIAAAWEATKWDDEIIKAELDRAELDPFRIIQSKREEEAWSFLYVHGISRKRLAELKEIAITNGVASANDFMNLHDDAIRQLFGFRPAQIKEARGTAETRASKPNKILDYLKTKDSKSISMAIAAWDVLSKKNGASPITQWFHSKAEQWGIDVDAVARIILDKLGFWRGRTKEEIARSLQLSLAELVIADLPDPYTVNTRYDGSIERATEATRKYFSEKKVGQTKQDYIREQRKKVIQASKTQWEQTPQGQAAIEKQRAEARLSTLRYGVATIKDNIESISHVVGNVPEAPAMLAELAQHLHDFIAKHLPQLETPGVNPVALENAKLRKENRALRDRVESLERALQSQQSAGKLIAGAVAWSSTDFD